MSDYMFMLESHLSPEQNHVVSRMQAAAEEAGVTVFLSGGTMRDMMGGFPIFDMDFTVEGNGLKLARWLTQHEGVETLSIDEHHKAAEVKFANGVCAGIRSAHLATYSRPGAKPQVQAATIHEDLRGRDFTINAIALSLHRASRGLLLDPTNGMGDLERRELRAAGNYALYNEPVRLLRLLRLRARTRFTIEEKTWSQYMNAREAGLEEKIPAAALMEELRCMAAEPAPAELVETLATEGLLKLFSPALEGAQLNLAGLAKLQRVRQMVPFGADFPVQPLGLFLNILTEKLPVKDKAALVETLGMPDADRDAWYKLEGRAKKMEKALQSPGLRRASQIYHLLRPAAGEEILFLLLRSQHRMVQDRIKHYLQKYLPASMEANLQELQAAGLDPSSPRYRKAKEELIAKHLDARPKKVAPEAPVEEAPPAAAAAARK